MIRHFIFYKRFIDKKNLRSYLELQINVFNLKVNSNSQVHADKTNSVALLELTQLQNISTTTSTTKTRS